MPAGQLFQLSTSKAAAAAQAQNVGGPRGPDATLHSPRRADRGPLVPFSSLAELRRSIQEHRQPGADKGSSLHIPLLHAQQPAFPNDPRHTRYWLTSIPYVVVASAWGPLRIHIASFAFFPSKAPSGVLWPLAPSEVIPSIPRWRTLVSTWVDCRVPPCSSDYTVA